MTCAFVSVNSVKKKTSIDVLDLQIKFCMADLWKWHLLVH